MDDWAWTFDGLDHEHEGRRETLCTLGNGYLATRGAAPEAHADGVHYPGAYLAGVFNALTATVSGREVRNESMVNAPNWLPVTFRAETGDDREEGDGGDWFGEPGVETLSDQWTLDVARGLLVREAVVRDRVGRVFRVAQRRIVSMNDPHLAALETSVVAESWSGRLAFRCGLDGTVRNTGVARYAGLGDRHLEPLLASGEAEVVSLVVETNQSHVRIAEAARTRVRVAGARVPVDVDVTRQPGSVSADFTVDLRAGEPVVVEKVVGVFTSRDAAISEPAEEARARVTNADNFDELLAAHTETWGHLWESCRVDLGADRGLSRLVHFNLFHVLQTVSNNSVDLDAGVPARGLHGEAYRGHIFWDEVFVHSFLALRFPQLSRSLLLYRYRRLDRARRGALEAGYAGAMFPWQSASNGREETQRVHLNPSSGHWLPDASHLQRHVNAAITHDVWQYYLATGDIEFLRLFGAEMILEIARFWASAATFDDSLGRYEIKGVVGPDEYHDGYPDRVTKGLDNNAYTNVMAVWTLCRAFDALETLPDGSVEQLRDRLALGDDELARWHDVSHRMRVCFHEGVISQFQGYEALEELDWDRYRRVYGDVARLDRILEAEGDSPNRYKVAKQGDVVMLFYLLSADVLAGLMNRLGYGYDSELIPRNVAYYGARTAHGSTLSRVVHGWVQARLDPAASWHLLREAARGDADDVQHGTTKEGVHLGAMAGTVDIVQRCYPGIDIADHVLRFDPVLPDELESLGFSIRYRGHFVRLRFTAKTVTVAIDLDDRGPILVEVRGDRRSVRPGETAEFALEREAAGPATPAPDLGPAPG